jgi:hypothetical protein
MGFGEAFHRAWVGNASGTTRNTFAAVGCLCLVALQIAMFVMADNTWALIGVLLLPAAAWMILVGWVYQRQGWRAIGLLLAVLGAFVPFYLM